MRRVRSLRPLLLTAALVLLASASGAQETAEWYREQADEAIRAERYDRAVDILSEAQLHYDGSIEFFMRLGDLYYDEELYELALAEYQHAEAVDPGAYEVLSAIAFTLGLLNREADSADTWSRLADLYPQRIEPVQNLGWLLFKLHRLEEGVELLLEAWDSFGPDADIAMTLGTLHAELYRFGESSRWYRRSIELARANESESFVAVAFYNLSLIQKLFHRYDDAMESTEQSLAILPRPTGYLARGELYELRMDYRAAHADYLRAYETDDDTPLGRLNLALLYQRFGRLDEALAFATSVFEESDNSWLYYYGTDVRRHRMELHDMLADIHDGLARTARMRATAGPLPWLRRAWDVVRHTVLGWYHRARFRDHASSVGEEVLAGGNLIDGNWYLYRANEGHARVAAAYLGRARELEVAAIPEAAPAYAIEAALLDGDGRELLRVADGLESAWQRRLLEEALAGALINDGGLSRETRTRAAARLYAINRGALRQHGVELPVRLTVDAERASTRRTVRRLLSRSGFSRVDPATRAPRLAVVVRPAELTATLDVAGEVVTASATAEGLSRGALADAVRELADALFVVE